MLLQRVSAPELVVPVSSRQRPSSRQYVSECDSVTRKLETSFDKCSICLMKVVGVKDPTPGAVSNAISIIAEKKLHAVSKMGIPCLLFHSKSPNGPASQYPKQHWKGVLPNRVYVRNELELPTTLSNKYGSCSPKTARVTNPFVVICKMLGTRSVLVRSGVSVCYME